jgi:peptide/nickel transport system permease protein
MSRYLARRAMAGAAVIAGLLVLAFFATHYIGDPVFLLVDSELTTPEERDQLIRDAGFDRPVWEQFADFFGGALRGDFGESIWQNRPATLVVFERLPATLLLAGASLAVTFAIAVPCAVLAARNHNSRFHTALTVATTAMGSLPSFWIALALIFLFAIQLQWLPTSGYGGWQHLVLPTIALAIGPVGRYTQVLEAGITSELRKPYVSTARAKGLRERVVMSRHVLRNASVLALTLLAGEVLLLMNGAVVVETIFAWPGVGNIALTAVLRRDLPVLMAAVVYIGVLVTVVNLLVDVAYGLIDPRVKLT